MATQASDTHDSHAVGFRNGTGGLVVEPVLAARRAAHEQRVAEDSGGSDFDDIDWKAVGLARPPGNSSAQRLMADNWSRLRTEPRFDDIDWSTIRDSGNRTSAQHYDEETGPFTRDEAHQLSAVWSKIRDAGSFADVNWKAVGLSRAPGDREAQIS